MASDLCLPGSTPFSSLPSTFYRICLVVSIVGVKCLGTKTKRGMDESGFGCLTKLGDETWFLRS